MRAAAALLVAGLAAACLASPAPSTRFDPMPTGGVPAAGTGRPEGPVVVPSPAPAATALPSPVPSARPEPTIEQLIGQKLVVNMDGVEPSADLLGRIRRGEVGGVILFAPNITTAAGVTALTGRLREAATAGGQPPLLIAVDQEGGIVKRIGWAPPTLTPPAMGRDGRASVALVQGAMTGAALRGLGFNVDLAPVADVPGAGSFMLGDGRTFSSSAAVTALLADAFATGLRWNGVLPAMKHFPGIGLAAANTDRRAVTITANAAGLEPGLVPFRTAIANNIPLIMLSNAAYAAYDAANAAGWSRAIGVALLRERLGFTGVSITDALDGTAASRAVSIASLALKAAGAGTDMLLTGGPEGASAVVHAALLRAVRDGDLSRQTLRDSYDRILALKASL